MIVIVFKQTTNLIVFVFTFTIIANLLIDKSEGNTTRPISTSWPFSYRQVKNLFSVHYFSVILTLYYFYRNKTPKPYILT